jgi:hypothetical protein
MGATVVSVSVPPIGSNAGIGGYVRRRRRFYRLSGIYGKAANHKYGEKVFLSAISLR